MFATECNGRMGEGRANPAGAGAWLGKSGNSLFIGIEAGNAGTAAAIEADGYFGPYTEAAVRQFERGHALVPDGIVGPRSWVVVDVL